MSMRSVVSDIVMYSITHMSPVAMKSCDPTIYIIFCLLITCANSLEPDQDRHKVGPDLDPNHLTL